MEHLESRLVAGRDPRNPVSEAYRTLRTNMTDRGAIRYASEQLRNVTAPLLGAVLNDVDFKRDGRYGGAYGKYGYRYEYYYGRVES